MPKPERNQKGLAMMVVLWVLVLLMALATEFAYSMKTEVNTTRNHKEDIEAYHLARAGIALAQAEMLTPARFHSRHPEHGFIAGLPKPAENPAAQAGRFTSGEKQEEELEYVPVQRTGLPLGNGTLSYAITDENSKIGINNAPRAVLIKALTLAGVEIGEERDTIADSILDWIDADSNHRINGAEDEHYQGLNPPYRCKNAPIESMDELLKVRGMTEEILFGTGEDDEDKRPGLKSLFTAYAVPAVNPNTASREVLEILYNESQLEEIFRLREEKGYYNDTVSSHFRIESTGFIGRTRHSIAAVIQKTGTRKQPALLTQYWNDNFFEP